MTGTSDMPASSRNYYVDEAGDGTLFDERGRVIVGNEGCSRHFILGMVVIKDEQALEQDLESLRADLLNDPYFKRVPSMQSGARKTAWAFHAKDDVPEVRHQVFSVIRRHKGIRCFADVRRKETVVEYVRQRNERAPVYRYNPDELYDYLVRCLFKDLLHKHDEYNIYFAKRGNSDRTAALRSALEAARSSFNAQSGMNSNARIHVRPCVPRDCSGLQVADYFLWALQRLYERGDDRYVEFLWPAFGRVHDLDDTRGARRGVFYTRKRPLTLAALKGLPGI